MKTFFNYVILSVVLLICSGNAFSQDDNQGNEIYCRAHTALEDFKVLGVNNSQFAKCVRSVNYLEADKRLKYVIINDMEFIDDGKKNDLVANDGVLTSTQLFTYPKGGPFVEIGTYRSVKDDIKIHDVSFSHQEGIKDSPQADKFGISCTFVWVPCSSWPPQYRSLCYGFGWPYGNFELRDCTVSFSL